ncbi:zinc finger family protein [Dorcoceras hygrometricum]|uniref:RBR-type E3 ubiquitin transferase n=1 Tax=Dorcoceras hygrometricum TaxID=472368 RepID=A0A2Z7AXX8_9LAMI|nr:zinc finger family protein [Dorcoceras hygrometricum]
MATEDRRVNVSGSNVNAIKAKHEDDEDEFRSCCEDEDELKDVEVNSKMDPEDNLDELSVKMYFKGISVTNPGDSCSGVSGIGVVMHKSGDATPVRVQKKLDFYVEESIADYLALLDGLSVAMEKNILRVLALTDSQPMYDQITRGEVISNPLLLALRRRILEKAGNMESFVLKVAQTPDQALRLAQVAIGVVSFPAEGAKATEICSICSEEKLSSMMLTIKCSHTFCSHCMRTYVEEKVQSFQVPIRCPQPKCKYCISSFECRSFLPVTSYECLEKAHEESKLLISDKIFCPYPNCSVLLDPKEFLSTRASSSSQSDDNCMECPVCQRFMCVDCGLPWHSSVTCEEYRKLPVEERDASDLTLHRLTQNRRLRRCQQCRSMIELTDGCSHMTCWCCGNDFCFSCGAEYRDGQQTCQCALWDEDCSDELASYQSQHLEQWAWDSFESLPMMMDAYSEQERSQLALIHRFLAGGFSLTDHQPYQSPPRCTDSYVDAMKDLNQLPWLERFVSVINDNYYEDLIQ